MRANLSVLRIEKNEIFGTRRTDGAPQPRTEHWPCYSRVSGVRGVSRDLHAPVFVVVAPDGDEHDALGADEIKGRKVPPRL